MAVVETVTEGEVRIKRVLGIYETIIYQLMAKEVKLHSFVNKSDTFSSNKKHDYQSLSLLLLFFKLKSSQYHNSKTVSSDILEICL